MNTIPGIRTRHQVGCARRSRPRSRCSCTPTYLARPIGSREIREAFPARTFKTLQEALDYQAACTERAPAVVALAASAATLGALLRAHLEGLENGSILVRSGTRAKPSTCHGYRVSLGHVDADPIAGELVSALTVGRLQVFFDRLAAGHYSASTVHNAHTLISAALTRLVGRGELPGGNPAHGVKLPRKARKEPLIVSPDEIQQLVATLPDHQLRAAFALFALAGLRLGEALALYWRDVDLEGGRVHVRDAWDPRARQFVGTKSSSGVRSVPIVGELRRVLLAHDLASGRRGPSGLVLVGADGRSPANPAAIRKQAKSAWTEAGLLGIDQNPGRHKAI